MNPTSPAFTGPAPARPRLPALISALLAAGCGGGAWEVEIWGEDYIEEGMGDEVFADGCAATFSRFDVALAEVGIAGDGKGQDAAAAPGATFDLVAPGPQAVTTVDAPAGAYTEVRFRIAGEGDGPAVDVEGTLSCPSGAVDFGWTFFSDTTYVCTPNGLTLGRGEAAATQVTVHGDHLFYDGLEDPEAEVRGEAFVAADADQDGTLTVDELEIVPVAALGYSVGAQSEVRTLWDFVQAQIPGLGHLDGEGHCDTEG